MVWSSAATKTAAQNATMAKIAATGNPLLDMAPCIRLFVRGHGYCGAWMSTATSRLERMMLLYVPWGSVVPIGPMRSTSRSKLSSTPTQMSVTKISVGFTDPAIAWMSGFLPSRGCDSFFPAVFLVCALIGGTDYLIQDLEGEGGQIQVPDRAVLGFHGFPGR